MNVLLLLTGVSVIVSFFADRHKTLKGINKGVRMFIGIFPSLISILLLVSIVLWLVPQTTISAILGRGAGWTGFFIAGLVGSISLLPGFIAYPLSAVLLKSGVSYQVIAVFITTLMMVGVFTLPLESRYFGWRASIMRNLLSLIAAFVIGALMRCFL